MKKKWMLTGIVSLVIVLVGLFALTKWNEYKKTEIVENVEAKMYTIAATDIARIEIYDGQSLIFNKQGELWVDEEVNELEYEQDKIKMMINELDQMNSFQMISNVQDIGTYGISENSKMITIYDKANVSETIRIGNNVSGQDASYIWSDTTEAIYLVAHSQLNDVFYNKEDIVSKEMNMPSVGDIQQMIIIENDKRIKFVRNPKRGTPGYDTWLVEEAFKTVHEVNNQQMEGCLEQLETFQRDKFVTTDTEQLEVYGLDKPSLMIELNGKYTIKFGKVDGDYIYFKYSGSPYIYKMLNEKINSFKGIVPFDLIRKEIYVPHLESLTSITLQQGDAVMEWILDKPYTAKEQVEIVNVEATKAQADGDKVEVAKGPVEWASYIGEVPMTLEQTESLLSYLGAISLYKPLVNPEFEEKEERTAEIKITYHLKDNTNYTIELIPYDPSYYILRYKGYVEFSVDKKSVVSFFNELNHIMKDRQKEISKG
ncbi:MAG: DUF4340 domain-containing protein [Cellulosilyticaceae bacterium]